MNKTIVIILAVVIIGGGGYLLLNNNQETTTNTKTASNSGDINQAEVNNKYVNYSEASFAEASDSKRVIFFHASWCSTCKIANIDFEKNTDKIPDDVIVFKTNYDKETELKKKYNINYQHTFVQVDKDGNKITSWNGGGVNNLISKVN